MPLVGRIVDVDRYRTAQDIAVVAPDKHLLAIDLPDMLTIQRVEIPSGQRRVHRLVREVITSIRCLGTDLFNGLEVVRTKVKACPGRKEDIAVVEDLAEGDLGCIFEREFVWPGLRIVL